MHYIACYGDSLVQGFPFGPRYSWTAEVEKHTQIKMLNYGICGECCDDIVFRVRQYALPPAPILWRVDGRLFLAKLFLANHLVGGCFFHL